VSSVDILELSAANTPSTGWKCLWNGETLCEQFNTWLLFHYSKK